MFKTFKKLPPLAQTAIYGAGGFLLYKQGKKIADRVKLRGDLQKYQAANLPIIVTNNGTQVQTNINLAAVANAIYDAFYNNDWFGATEDEERAIKEIQKVPKAYIQKLAGIYADSYKKDLYKDFVKFCSPSDFERVAYLFN